MKRKHVKENDAGSNQKFLRLFLISFATIILVSLAVFAVKNASRMQSGSPSDNSFNAGGGSGEVQVVNVRVQGANYIMDPAVLKVGVPARLVFDMSTVVGCSRAVILPDFGVRKSLTATDNIVEFTPLKEGTFTIACSMYMYTGKFSVARSGESGAAVAQNVQSSPGDDVLTATASAKPAGGCGCGGGSGTCGGSA